MRLVFADSELAAVEVMGDVVHLRFAAAAVEPSVVGEEHGYLLGLVVECRGARLEGDARQGFGRVLDAALTDGAVRLRHLDLPIDCAGTLRLALDLAHGKELVVQAASIHAVPSADTPFQPSLAC
ncbi:MAG: hypothetical protein V4609_16585 [Pseudomonadota bacterium]